MNVEIPTNAFARDVVVETMGGGYGRIIGHGWDAEGAFGYFLSVDHTLDRVWIYHKVVTSRGRNGVWQNKPGARS